MGKTMAGRGRSISMRVLLQLQSNFSYARSQLACLHASSRLWARKKLETKVARERSRGREQAGRQAGRSRSRYDTRGVGSIDTYRRPTGMPQIKPGGGRRRGEKYRPKEKTHRAKSREGEKRRSPMPCQSGPPEQAGCCCPVTHARNSRVLSRDLDR